MVEIFKKWELAAIDELRGMISTAYQISSRWQTEADFEQGCMILDPLADLQGQLDVLMTGNLSDRIGIYRRWRERGKRF